MLYLPDSTPHPCSRYAVPMDETPVGLKEIGERLGVARVTVDKWRARDRLPPPRWTVGGHPAWAWCDVEAWAIDTGRLPSP